MMKDRIRSRLLLGAIRASLLTVSIAAVVCIPLRGQSTAAPCSSDPAFGWLDFWVGEWEVFVEGEEVGENRIQKILNGCAISEEWTDARSRHGYSLFYFQPVSKTWKQVWVTDRALARGGVKEKN